jgi:F1F0 ATPase subunit 2
MTHGEIIALGLAALLGVLLGIVYFRALWWTVSYGLRSNRPALLFFFSFVGRMIFVLSGFYVAGSGHWDRLVACLLGFLAGRALIGCRLPSNTKDDKGGQCT